MTFNEDQRRIRDRATAGNWAVLQKIALNLLKSDTKARTSIRGRRREADAVGGVGQGQRVHGPTPYIAISCVSPAREGDCLVVWRLDRFGRSLKDLIAKVEPLKEKGVQFKSLKENLGSAGRLQFHIFGALTEFEWDLNRERTMARGPCPRKTYRSCKP